MNRRSLILSAIALPVLFLPVKAETIVPRGIRFLGKYPKTVYYSPFENRYMSAKWMKEWVFHGQDTSHLDFLFWEWPDMKFTPAPLSVYAKQIEIQTSLGYRSWELI